MRRMLLASMLILAPATAGFAQSTARMEQLVQSYVSSAGFSGTVLVARGDSVVFRNGYGVSPDAASPVASITKQFTAAAILLLEERGRLRIDDDGRTIPLLAESETSFFMEGTNVRVEFVRDAGGVVTGLIVHQGSHQERATRLR